LLSRLPTFIRWGAAVAWTAFVWLSLTFAPRSGGEPGWLDDLIARLAPLLEGTSADKLVHAALFAVLALLVLRAIRAAGPIPWVHRTMVVLVATLYGGLTEWVQAGIPARTASWGDFVADLLGAAFVGWLVGRAGRGGRGGSIPTPPATSPTPPEDAP
jgi:hypothetical protein